MNNLLREPLIQFLLLGTILFVIFEFIGQYVPEKQRQIVVTPEQIDTLNKGFVIDFARQPTPADTERLIQDYIREEVLVQEAAKLGYHMTDQNIRIELRRRMEAAHSLIPVPTDEDLEQFLKQNPDKFRTAPGEPVPPLAQIRPAVRNAWNTTRRKEVLDTAFHNYLQNYIVVVQRTGPAATAPATGASQ